MAALTMTALQPLLEQFAGEEMVLSCYADLGVTEGFRPNWRGPFQADADAIWKMIGEDGRARDELQQNLQIIRRALEEAGGARWLAVFSAARRKFFQTFVLDAPVVTSLVLDRSPYLVPLLEANARRREYLVIHTDTHRGRIYAASRTAAELLQEIDEEVPKKQRSAGERWGKEQATIARHRDDRILHYQKELIRRVEHAWSERSFAGIMLLGEHEMLEHFRKELPARLAEKVLSAEAESWYERLAQTEKKILELVERLTDAAEAKVAEDFWERLREKRAIVAGPRAVLEALTGGAIAPRGAGCLVFGPDPREVVGRCSACRALAFDAPAVCPRCAAPCVEANLWEELLLTALRHDIAVHFVKEPEMLAPYGGIVALVPNPATRSPSAAAIGDRAPVVAGSEV